ADQRLALAQAAGDDHLAVLGHRLADRIQRLGHRRVDEAAGVDHHHVRIVVAGHQLIALDAQLGEDALGVDQRLGAAEADETDLGTGCGHGEPWLEDAGGAAPGRHGARIIASARIVGPEQGGHAWAATSSSRPGRGPSTPGAPIRPTMPPRWAGWWWCRRSSGSTSTSAAWSRATPQPGTRRWRPPCSTRWRATSSSATTRPALPGDASWWANWARTGPWTSFARRRSCCAARA